MHIIRDKTVMREWRSSLANVVRRYLFYFSHRLFHIPYLNYLVSVQIPGDRARIKLRVKILPRASSLETKLSLSWYRLIKIISRGCMSGLIEF